MQISSAQSQPSAQSLDHRAVRSEPTPPTPPIRDVVSLCRVSELLSVLQGDQGVRPEVLARGRALAADSSYPPPEVVSKLAGLVMTSAGVNS